MEVALTKEAHYKEVCKKSLRDFYKTHPSGSGTVTKIAPSVAKIKPSITNEGTGAKLEVLDMTEEESTKSEAESWGKDEDDRNSKHDSRTFESDQEENEEEIEDDEEEEEDKFVKTPSNDTNDEDEIKIKDKDKSNEDEGIDYTTNQFDDDVDLRMNKPVTTDEGFIQKEGTDAQMINVQRGNENPKITLNQVIEDAHVTLSTVPWKTEILVTSSSHSSDLAFKFLNFLDIPHTDAEIVSPIDVHVHHEVPSKQIPTLLIVPVSVIIVRHLTLITILYSSTSTIYSNSTFTPCQGENTRHNIMDIITRQWCQQ
nr:hypothetical protein [Tanacetum cinerariifolium]